MDFTVVRGEPIGMRALCKPAPGPGVSLVEVPDPRVEPDSVLIRVLRTGICGTDLHIDSWDEWAQRTISPPRVLGHEFVGEVVEVGSHVRQVSVGELVSGEGHLVCGECRSCRAGRRHLCNNILGLGIQVDGAFAEYVTLPAQNVWVHRYPVDLDVAAIFDPFGNAVHSAGFFPLLNEDVLVTGAGPIGLMAAIVAQHAGARHVVVTDVNPYRLKIAEQLGAIAVDEPSVERLRQVMEQHGLREGFDVLLEMSGRPQALESALPVMVSGGRCALLGLPAEQVTLDLASVVTKMLSLQGIYGREMFETWYAMSVLVQAGVDLSPVITHRFGYEEHAQAFTTARSGECGKVVIDWTTPRITTIAEEASDRG